MNRPYDSYIGKRFTISDLYPIKEDTREFPSRGDGGYIIGPFGDFPEDDPCWYVQVEDCLGHWPVKERYLEFHNDFSPEYECEYDYEYDNDFESDYFDITKLKLETMTRLYG